MPSTYKDGWTSCNFERGSRNYSQALNEVAIATTLNWDDRKFDLGGGKPGWGGEAWVEGSLGGGEPGWRGAWVEGSLGGGEPGWREAWVEVSVA